MSTQETPRQQEEWTPRSPRQRLMFALAALAVVVVGSILFFLFGPGGSEPEKPVNVADLPYVDGTLVVVEPPRLVLRPFGETNGGREIEFTIRDQDMGNFDVAHLRSHSSIGLPTRIYYLESGERRFAVYKEDAPANSSRQNGS